MKILEGSNLTMVFGGLSALNSVDITINEGEVLRTSSDQMVQAKPHCLIF